MDNLNASNNVWTGGMTRMRAYRDDGTRPTLALWMTSYGGVVDMALESTAYAPTRFRALLADALANARKLGRGPARIEVCSDDDLDAIAKLPGLPPVSVVDNPFFRTVAYDQEIHLGPLRQTDTFFEPGLSRAAIEDMARACNEFAQSVPRVEGEPAVLHLHAPSLGLRNTCVWVGNEVLVGCGFVAFKSAQDYENAMRVDVRYTHEWDGDNQSRLALCTQNPTARRNLVRELKRIGLRRRDIQIVPELDAYDEEGIRRPTLPNDLEQTTAIARALAEAHPQIIGVGTHGSPATVRVAVAVGKTTHGVDVTYPHPEVGPELVELSNCSVSGLIDDDELPSLAELAVVA